MTKLKLVECDCLGCRIGALIEADNVAGRSSAFDACEALGAALAAIISSAPSAADAMEATGCFFRELRERTRGSGIRVVGGDMLDDDEDSIGATEGSA